MSKYTINLSPEMESILNELASEQHVAKSAVIRRAVKLMKYLGDEREAGRKIIVRSPEEDMDKEIVFESDIG